MQSKVIHSSECIEMLVAYFERVQWEICFSDVAVAASGPINTLLHVPQEDFSLDELFSMQTSTQK